MGWGLQTKPSVRKVIGCVVLPRWTRAAARQPARRDRGWTSNIGAVFTCTATHPFLIELTKRNPSLFQLCLVDYRSPFSVRTYWGYVDHGKWYILPESSLRAQKHVWTATVEAVLNRGSTGGAVCTSASSLQYIFLFCDQYCCFLFVIKVPDGVFHWGARWQKKNFSRYFC